MEYEAWFLAAAASLGGQRELSPHLVPPADAEGIRDAKGWLSRHMQGERSYRETLDQPALSARLDLDLARSGSPSFDKLWRTVSLLLEQSG